MEKYKVKQYFKKFNDRLNYTYNDNRYNIVIISIIIVILSRVLMYLEYKVGHDFFNINNNFINTINIWDSGWYRGLIENGYNLYPTSHKAGDAANWAFFPLYPLIIKGVHYIFPIDIYILGTIISTIFFILALVVSYIYIVETRNSQQQAIFFITIMCFGMYSFYFSILYTESLYLLLLVLALYFLHKENYIVVGIIGVLLSATRNLGVMLVFAVLVKYTISYLHNKDKSMKGYFVSIFKNTNFMLGTLLIPFGLFSYMAYLGNLVGDPMAFSHIQIAWGRHISNPLSQLVHGLFKEGNGSTYLSIWAIFAIVCVIWLSIAKRWVECILAFIFVIVPLSTGVNSIPRYVIGSFVYVLSFTDIIKIINKRWLWNAVLIISILGEFILLIKWFQQSSLLC